MQKIIIIAACLLLASCTLKDSRVADVQTPLELGIAQQSKPIEFSVLKFRLTPGKRFGGLYHIRWCERFSHLNWTRKSKYISNEDMEGAFIEELQNAGYNAIGDPDALFNTRDDVDPELVVAGVVKDLDLHVCQAKYNIVYRLGDPGKVKGSAYMEIDWQIFSTLDKRVVHTVATEGSVNFDTVIEGDEATLITEAFAVAVRNLLADEKFHQIARKDAPLPGNEKKTFTKLSLKGVRHWSTPFKDDVNRLRAGVVTIRIGNGHGSGFVISDEGYVLTNAHVVRGNTQIRVVTATGREILGEVLRKDNRRDIALVKIEPGLMAPLPVKMAELDIGADIFAAGTPGMEELSTTISGGIVSAYRMIREQRYIQGDVAIHEGNSGGPLLDKNGNVVGVSVAGFEPDGVSTSLNLFIPIRDALKALNIKIERK